MWLIVAITNGGAVLALPVLILLVVIVRTRRLSQSG